jgi:NCAIR mutase (PurE)-related protein
MVQLTPSSIRQVHVCSNKWEVCSRLRGRSNDTWIVFAAHCGGMGSSWEGVMERTLQPVIASPSVTAYSQVGNLENTTSLLSLFYAGFIGIAVVLITDY